MVLKPFVGSNPPPNPNTSSVPAGHTGGNDDAADMFNDADRTDTIEFGIATCPIAS